MKSRVRLHEVRAASYREQPMLVFAPGFLSGRPWWAGKPARGWRNPVAAVAERWGAAASILEWPAASIEDLLPLVPGLDARLPARLLFPASPVLPASDIALNLAVAWKRARKAADSTGAQLHWFLTALKRPVILMGHSLGARLALRAAEHAPRGFYEAVLAFAPAALCGELDYREVRRGTDRGAAVFASRNDSILKTLFRVGELEPAHPILGVEGVPPRERVHVRSMDVSTFQAREIGHLAYRGALPGLVDQFSVA